MSETETYPGYDMKVWLRCCEEVNVKPLEGQLIGDIPRWVSGALFRNGPGTLKIGSSQFGHIFDGSALLHKFAINNGSVTYQCRFLNSETYRKNHQANRIVISEFATIPVPDPCHTIFDRISSIFKFNRAITDNAGVSIYPFGDQIYAMTEVPQMYKIHKESLDTLNKKSLINSLIVCHTAHPHVMPDGDVYNVGLQIVKGLPKHVVVKFPFSKTGDMFDSAEIISVIEPRWRFSPAYMHSFGISENYFIIIEQPLSISLLHFLKTTLLKGAFDSALVWYPEYETQIILIHRGTGNQTRYITETFFFMHLVNCYESNGNLYVDVIAYKDAKIIDAMYVETIKNVQNIPDYGQWLESRPKRIEIPLDAPSNTRVESKIIADIGIEAPRMNYDAYNGRPYKYFYGIGSDVSSKFAGSLIKIDTKTGDVVTWRELDSYPSEPVFVAHPGAKNEDDGVLLSAILWGKDDHMVTLLVLNASDMKEIARANFNTKSQVPKCFHGWFMPE